MYLIFDTETTGVYDFKRDRLDPAQPRICQLAMMLVDETDRIVAEFSTLIQPEDWHMNAEAAAVHGITEGLCLQYGIQVRNAMAMFKMLSYPAKLIIGHNVGFDMAMVDRELALLGVDNFLTGKEVVDTMALATELVQAPLSDKQVAAQAKHKDSGWAPPGGWPTYKSPTLSETFKHFFDVDFDGAHDAMADVRATRQIYFRIKQEL